MVDLLASEYPDVTHSSLRFLEREGLIQPARTPGGHRLFPPDQIERIRMIKTWQGQRLSLEEIKRRFASIEQLPELTSIAERLLELLIQGDRAAAQELIVQVDDAGLPLESIFDGIVRPILRETGDRWDRQELTVGQEKEISGFVRDLIANLGQRRREDSEWEGPVLIAACVDGENHELGLRMITALLRERGFAVYYLGPSVSNEFLIERITVRQPAAVLLAAVTRERLPALASAVSSIFHTEELDPKPTVIVVGAGVPADWQPGVKDHTVVVTQPDMSQTIAQIERILSRSEVQI
ncbi:MAG: MerR family transcriptional regulator [Thermomicrobiales bacterium]